MTVFCKNEDAIPAMLLSIRLQWNPFMWLHLALALLTNAEKVRANAYHNLTRDTTAQGTIPRGKRVLMLH